MKVSRLLLGVPVIAAMLLGAGCATVAREKAPPADFLSSKGTIGLVWVAETDDPVADYHQLGSQGLIDVAINKSVKAKSQLTERLVTEKVSPLIQQYYLDVFGQALKAEGFDVTVVEKPLLRKSLVKFESPKGQKAVDYAPLDFRPVASEEKVDRLVVLDLNAFGVARNYYGFLPTGPPRGYTLLALYLVNGADNTVAARYPATVANELSDGAWDDPPEYPALMKASHTSLEKSVDAAFLLLFGRAP